MTLLHRRLALLAVAAGGVLAVATERAMSGPRLDAIPFAAVLLLLALGELRVMSARVGNQQVSVSLVEIAAMVGLASLPGEWVVLTGALAATCMQIFRRKALLKAVFAVSLSILGLGLAVAVTGMQPRLTSGLTPWLDLRLAAGALAYGVGSIFATAFVAAAARKVSIRQCVGELGYLHIAIAGANVAAGFCLLLLAQFATATLIVVPPLVAAIYLTYSLYLRADEERVTWQRLERASADMIALAVDDVASHAVLHAHSLFGPDRVKLLLFPGATITGGSHATGVSDTTCWITDDGQHIDRAPESLSWTGGVVASSLADGVSAAVTVDDGAGRHSVLRCDLRGPQGVLGHLALSFTGSTALGKRDRQVLASYARTVAAALERAWLYEQTRELAVQKAHEAAHDGLTGLANRSLMQERVRAAVDAAGICSLLSIDLDNFKSVNDTLGHTTGDRLLILVADRLTQVVGDRGLVGRLGGDEFAVLMCDTDAQAADQLAGDILDVLRQPALLDGLRLSVGGSVGIALSPHDAATAEELFQHADVALYQAKESRGVYRRYRSEHDSSSVSRLELVAELGLALERSEFVLHYQPQADVMLGTLVGFEALVRWQHPTRGLLAPVEFIGAVEDSGLIRAFTRWVLERAVTDCAGWHRDGRSLTVAVNLSARNLLDSTLSTDVEDVLRRHGLPPEALVLEITETAMMGDIGMVENVLAAIRSLGVQVSVDDFGTGYSSLAFLQRVRVNEIKVDRSFVLGMLRNDGDAALVRATLDLARSFHLRVVAEGVETPALLAALAELGCNTAQGWHIGRPADLAATRVTLGLDAEPRERRGAGTPAQRSGGSVRGEVRGDVRELRV